MNTGKSKKILDDLDKIARSFVVIEKSTGKAVMETWNRGLALKINRERFDVLAIGDYLPTLSRKAERGEL